LGAIALLLVLAVAGLLIVSLRSHSTPTSASLQPPTVTHPTGTITPPTSSSTTSSTTVPIDPAHIIVDISAIDPTHLSLAQTVATTFEDLFDGINTRNFALAISAYLPTNASHVSEAALANGDSTSTDTNAALSQVTPTAFGGVIAAVAFTSHQDAAHSPGGNGDTCDNWSISYDLVPSGAGANPPYVINDVASSPASTHQAC
jgi:hypothetical protein